MTSTKSESGLRDHRIEFVRETRDAEGNAIVPVDPEWLRYSDVVRNFSWDADPAVEEQRGISDADPNNFFLGPEEHQLTVAYDLQKWLVDQTGDPLDASADGLFRDDDNLLLNSHTIIDREEKSGIAESNTIDGASGTRDSRQYKVLRGAVIDEAELNGDPGDQQPIAVELTYEAERGRSYRIDQPANDVLLALRSTSEEDTTQTVRLEAEDGTGEDVALNGNTPVSTTATFADLDSMWLDDETVGDVEIFENTGTDIEPAVGAQLAYIRGRDYYQGIEGDRGIPPTGAGTHAAPVGTPFQLFRGNEIRRQGARLAMDINSVAITVSNNTERTDRIDTKVQRIHAGTRDTTVDSTVLGEVEGHNTAEQSLAGRTGDIVWELSAGTITVPGAVLDDPGSVETESEEAVMTVDATFTGKGIEVA